METVSVIIVNHNGAGHLKDCLRSLLELDYPQDKVEILVFDNGSSDNSLRIIKQICPAAIIISHPTNLGFAAPHRIAAEKARGDVLALLNNDMRVDRQWIKAGISLLNPADGVVCVSSRILSWHGKKTDFIGGSLHYLGYADELGDATIKNGDALLFPCGGAMFINRKVFLESGGFDDDYFAIFEDVDLGWRLWIMGYRVVMANDSVVYHRGHATLDSRKEEKKRYLMHRNALMTLIKNYSDENLAKILPLALVLAVKRALLFMGVDKKDFYFWETQDAQASLPHNYQEACVHLAVLDDIFGAFQSLIEKRKTVQFKRKRDDLEIFNLFRDPFRNIMGYKEYLWDEVSLFGHFHLEELFKCENIYKERVDEGIYHARKTLRELMHEIEKTSSRTGVQIREQEGFRSLARKFFSIRRQDGFGQAIQQTMSYLKKKVTINRPLQ